MSKISKILLYFVLAMVLTVNFCYAIDLNLTQNTEDTNVSNTSVTSRKFHRKSKW